MASDPKIFHVEGLTGFLLEQCFGAHFFCAAFLHRPQISTALFPFRPPASFLKVDFFLGEVHSSFIISREQSKKMSWM